MKLTNRRELLRAVAGVCAGVVSVRAVLGGASVRKYGLVHMGMPRELTRRLSVTIDGNLLTAPGRQCYAADDKQGWAVILWRDGNGACHRKANGDGLIHEILTGDVVISEVAQA